MHVFRSHHVTHTPLSLRSLWLTQKQFMVNDTLPYADLSKSAQKHWMIMMLYSPLTIGLIIYKQYIHDGSIVLIKWATENNISGKYAVFVDDFDVMSRMLSLDRLPGWLICNSHTQNCAKRETCCGESDWSMHTQIRIIKTLCISQLHINTIILHLQSLSLPHM